MKTSVYFIYIYIFLLLQRNSSGILPLQEGFFTGYDPTVKAALFNSFSTAALRMGHTLIRDQMELLIRGLDDQNQPEPIPTREFFDPSFLYQVIQGNSPYGLLFRGLYETPAQNVDKYVRYFYLHINALLK